MTARRSWGARSAVISCALLVASILVTPAALAQPELEVMGTWGGAVKTVFIDPAAPDIAYVGSGRNLVILNVADPADIIELGAIDLGNLVQDVKVRDGYAYVGTYHAPNHFCIVDVSDLADPHVAWSSGDFTGGSQEVELHGNFAWVRTGTDLRRFEISDPENPGWGGTAIWSVVDAFTIVGELLYVGAGAGFAGEFRVCDLAADPGHPVLLGSAEFTYPPAWYAPTAVAVEGDYAYVTTQDNDPGVMAIVDVSDPAAPVVVGYCTELQGTVYDVAASGAYAYVPDGSGETANGLKVFDVGTDPSAPALVGAFDTHGAVKGVEVVGTRAYVLDEGEGLIILDISARSDPVRLGNWHSPAELRKMDKVGDLLYVTDEWNGITVLDVSDPLSPTLIGTYQVSEESGRWAGNWGLELRDGLAYLSAGRAGIEIIDVSAPSQPALVGAYRFEPTLRARAMELDGDIAHVGVKPLVGGFIVNFDISDPEAIVDVGFLGLGNAPLTIDTTPEGIAHLANSGTGGGPGTLAAVDTSDPTDPSLIRQGLPQAQDLVRRGTRAYVADPQDDVGGLRILDLSDPADPVELGHYVAHGCSAVAFQSGLAYLVGNDLYWPNGLLVLDVSDPASIALVAHQTLPGAMYDILVDGRHAYVTGGPDGYHANVGLMIVELDGLAAWGDLNCDGTVNFFDIDAFVLALSGTEEAYYEQFPDCNWFHADCNGDGEVDFFDIDAFVDLITGG